MQYLPYTYLIGWSHLDRWYYGVEYSNSKKVANPDNLWTTYFTSSKTIQIYREEYGEPDVVQVRKIFNVGNDANKRKTATCYEKRVLQRLKIMTSKRWLNESVTGHTDGLVPEWVRMKLSKALKGRMFTPEWKAKLKEAKQGENHPNFGKKRDGEIVLKISESNRGKKRSDKAKALMSIKAKERFKTPLVCPHCNKEGFGGNIYRYHFDRCKFK